MISVIFPVFNCEELLDDAINSILNQTFKEFELICIDNYSTDSSLDIIRQFEKKDSRIKVFICNQNNDLSYHVNHCIENTNRKYVYFFEPHFLLRNDAFETFITTLEANVGDYLIFNYHDNASDSRFDLGENLKVYESINLNSDFLFEIPISVGNVLILRSVLSNDNLYFDENLYENFYKLRFNSQKAIALNDSFATVEKDMPDLINSILDETKALFSIFEWVFESKDIYEYCKINFLEFIFKNLKKIYLNFSNLNCSGDEFLLYYNERKKIDDDFTAIFDKFYFDYRICKDLVEINESLADFFTEFLINKGKYRLSIVIPAFNCETYIRDTLDSLINQTLNFNTIEVIIVDDCSEDNTPQIIREYSEKYNNITAFFLEENSKYAGKPRNIALSNVSSNYVCFLDADDYFYPDACEKLYYNMLYSQADIVIGSFSMDKIEGGKKKKVDAGISYFNNLNEFDVLKFDSVKNNPHILSSANVWNKIFKADVIKDNHITFPEGVPAQDSGFLFHYLLNANELVFLDDIVVHYHNLRNSEGNKSVTHLRNELNIMGRIEVYHWMYDISLEYDVEQLFVENILRVKLPYWFNQLLNTELSDEKLKEIFVKHQVLFKRCIEYDLVLPKLLDPIFKLISESKYEDSVEEYKKIK